MNVSVKITLFALIIIAAFTLFSVYYIPAQKPAPVPKETRADLSIMDKEEIAAIGRYIYGVKGNCLRCHGSAGKRAPELKNITVTAARRVKENGYKGTARSSAEYIYESMLEPSVYVVEGYGKAGTNDTESPMPAASSRAATLTETEMRAVIVYLQDIAGVEPTPFFELPDRNSDIKENKPATGKDNGKAKPGR